MAVPRAAPGIPRSLRSRPFRRGRKGQNFIVPFRGGRASECSPRRRRRSGVCREKARVMGISGLGGLEVWLHADAEPADGAAVVGVPEAIVFDGHAVDLDGMRHAEDVVAASIFDALAAYDAE